MIKVDGKHKLARPKDLLAAATRLRPDLLQGAQLKAYKDARVPAELLTFETTLRMKGYKFGVVLRQGRPGDRGRRAGEPERLGALRRVPQAARRNDHARRAGSTIAPASTSPPARPARRACTRCSRTAR
jgi:hypothetical protein